MCSWNGETYSLVRSFGLVETVYFFQREIHWSDNNNPRDSGIDKFSLENFCFGRRKSTEATIITVGIT